MKTIQYLVLCSALVAGSAYANEAGKEVSFETAKNIVVADSLNNERNYAGKQPLKSVGLQNASNVHNVLNTKFLGKRPYAEKNFD